MNQEPWYRDGLRFTCTRCGHCCTGPPGFVWVSDAEAEAIAGRLGLSLDEFRAFHLMPVGGRFSLREKANGDCVMYDRDQGCTIYPVRPAQCRSWPFWESNLASPEAWERTCDICPGSGQGELIPVEEIARNLKLIRM